MNARANEGAIQGDRMLESLLRFLPFLLLCFERANRVFEIGTGTGERFLCNELEHGLVRLANCGQCMAVRIVERRFRGCVSGLL